MARRHHLCGMCGIDGGRGRFRSRIASVARGITSGRAEALLAGRRYERKTGEDRRRQIDSERDSRQHARERRRTKAIFRGGGFEWCKAWRSLSWVSLGELAVVEMGDVDGEGTHETRQRSRHNPTKPNVEVEGEGGKEAGE